MDKFIKRKLWSDLLTSLKKETITIIIGPRQVGKTTLLFFLKDYLKETKIKEEAIFYYNFDDIELRVKIKEDFYFLQKDIEAKLGKKIEETKNRIYLLIDEGQKAPQIFDLVKIFFDKKYPLKIFITGSSTLNIKEKTAETLAGRVNYLYLSPLLLTEIIEKDISIYDDLENIRIKDLQEKAAFGWREKEKIDFYFQKMVVFGSLPKVISLSQNESIDYFNNFISSYLEREIKDIGGRISVEKFYLSFKYLVDYTADLFNFSKLSSHLGIKRDSLYFYFALLEKTLILNTCMPLVNPLIKNIYKSRKLYFFDNGIINRLKGYLSLEEISRSNFLGRLFENFIFQNLKAKSLNDVKKPTFYYYRDYSNYEIDFVYQRGEIIIPIEVTYSEQITKEKLRNFHHFFKNHQANYGLIFYLGELKEIKINHRYLFALPYFLV